MSLPPLRHAVPTLAWFGAVAALAISVFALDLSAPDGQGIYVAYTALALTGVWAPRRTLVVAVAGIATLLLFIGLLASPEGSLSPAALVGRTLALIVVWVIALMALERRTAERPLIDRERRLVQPMDDAAGQSALLAATFEHMAQGIGVFDRDETLVAFNAQYARISGLPEQMIRVGMTRADLVRHCAMPGLYGDRDGDALIEDRGAADVGQDRGARTLPNGTTYLFERVPTPDGGSISTLTDITEWRKSEKAREQAEKMEAVGQLTGGVAHDFNNLLGVSLGNLELARESLDRDEDIGPFLDAAVRAVQRGASLTSQLMAFSCRQALNPEVTNPAVLIEELLEVVGRTLGPNIELRFEPAGDVWPISIDRSQLHSALLNLAVNARDAMPDGGRITVSCSNLELPAAVAAAKDGLEPGAYVALSVADTGIGMPPEVRDHAFEPFFTTKDVGKGSGLGLSMVYGFAKQSDGSVVIESDPGQGTTVRIYLPRASEHGIARAKPEKPATDGSAVSCGDGGKILLIEDDADVRATTTTMLTSAGYDVVAVDDGPKALALLAEGQQRDVDLVLSDIVLTGPMNGIEVAQRLRADSPDLHVVFMTGYADKGMLSRNGLETGDELIRKPFTKGELVRFVQKAVRAKVA